jgi:NAD(P)H-hydrate epimerase
MSVTVAQMKAIEERAESIGISRILMMENAGHGIAHFIESRFGPLKGKEVVVVCGSGNNGGDGLATARHISTWGAKPIIVLTTKPSEIKTSEASQNWKIINSLTKTFEVKVCDSTERTAGVSSIFSKATLLIDAIFGTGVKGKIREPQRTLIQLANSSLCPRIAIDVPSGLDPDTGEVADFCIKADVTLTLHKMKPGLLRRKDLCGEIVVLEIGIPPEIG